MHRTIRAIIACALLLVLVVVAGCTGAGGGGGEKNKVWGYVASDEDAQLEAESEQIDTTSLAVDRVVSPGAAWLVVHLEKDGMPGDRVGLLHVDEGESTDLLVPLEGVTTKNVIVAVHADRGEANEFDFDMMNKEMSPDRPYFVGGKELARVVQVGE